MEFELEVGVKIDLQRLFLAFTLKKLLLKWLKNVGNRTFSKSQHKLRAAEKVSYGKLRGQNFLMPRHIFKPQPKSAEQIKLTEQLTTELTQDTQAIQPVILEQELPSGWRHVHVIWDAWQALSGEERSQIILDAYQRVEQKEEINDISIASGITAREALAVGLLPYKIVPLVRRTDENFSEDCKKAMSDEAALTLLGELHDGTLRYATLEDANHARERLETKWPKATWSVVEEVANYS